MRRKDKEIADKKEIEKILIEGKICRLSIANNNVPYLVPVNYGYMDNTIYIHSAKEGKKIEWIKNNNYICFEIEADCEISKDELACEWGMKYKTIIGYGHAEFILNPDEKKNALDIIMNQYDKTKKYEYNNRSVEKLAVIRLRINEICGKKSG